MKILFNIYVFLSLFFGKAVFGNDSGEGEDNDAGKGGDDKENPFLGESLGEKFKGRGHWGGRNKVIETSKEIAAAADKAEKAENGDGEGADNADDKKGDKKSEKKEKKGDDEVNDDTEVTIGEHKVTAKALGEVIEAIRKDVGEEEFDSLPEKVQDRMVQMHLDKEKAAEDAKKAKQAAMKKGQDNNKAQKEVEEVEEKYKLEIKKYQDQNERIIDDVESKTAEIKKLKDEIAETKKLKEDAIPDDLEDDKRLRAVVKQENAEKELPKLEEKLKQLEKTLETSVAQSQANYTLSLIAELQHDFPELRTDDNVEVIIHKKFKGYDKNEQVRASRIQQVILDYYNKYPSEEDRAEITISDFYSIQKHNLPEIKAEKKEAKVIKKEESTKSVLQRILKKQKDNPSNPRGTSSSVREGEGGEGSILMRQRKNARAHWGKK